jgi:hypothetical protein
MKIVKRILILLLLLHPFKIYPQDTCYHKNYVKPIVWSASINGLVYSFDRIMGKPKVNANPFKAALDNISGKYVFDTSLFITNFIGHPYHGALYTMAARSNGLSYYMAIPYNFAGSYIWEIGAEAELPSINDLIVTPLSGAMVGEMLFRISETLYHSGNKARKLASYVINPISIVERNVFKNNGPPVIGNGIFNIGVSATLSGRKVTPNVFTNISYGEQFEDNPKPMDWFNLYAEVSFDGKIHMTKVNSTGSLYSVSKKNMVYGMYQHFNYYADSSSEKRNEFNYKITEPVSVGPGIGYKTKGLTTLLYLSDVLFGAYDNDRFRGRNYNMATGFSVRQHSTFSIGNHMGMSLESVYYKFFTPSERMGDVGNADILIFSPSINCSIDSHYNIILDYSWIYMNRRYKHFDDRENNTHRIRLGIGYKF